MAKFQCLLRCAEAIIYLLLNNLDDYTFNTTNILIKNC